MTEQVSPPSVKPTEPTQESSSASEAASPGAAGRQGWARIALVLVVAFAIVGSAWFVGERQGWDTIGSGGVNAQMLPKVGEPAPELFTLYADGRPMLLSTLKGQPVWINFWGSWCPPCRAEMPELQGAYETLAPQGVVMLAISMREDPADAVAYAEASGATFPVLMDPNWVVDSIDAAQYPQLAPLAESTRTWQIVNFPTHIFIDRDGIVQAVVIEPMNYETAVSYGEMILNPQPASAVPIIAESQLIHGQRKWASSFWQRESP